MKELIIKKGDKQITLADKEDVMDALEDKSDKSHDHDSTYIKKTGGVSQHSNGNIIIPSASDTSANDATGKIPFAGHLTSSEYSIEDFTTKLKSVMGGLKDKDNVWWNVISARQTNGGGSAGENQGLLLKTLLKSTGDLIWNKQYNGNWGTEKTILDSSNYSTYANKTTIANNLTTTTAGSALDATQGKALNDSIDNLSEQVDDIVAGDVNLTNYAKKEDVMDALEDKSDKSHDHDSTYIKKTGGVSQHSNGNIIIPSASDATDNDATGKIPFAGHLISTTYSIEEFVTKLKSFMGGIKDKDNKWWNVISARQTNGGGSAGENQGLLLKTRLESTGDLIWNKQSTGSWDTEKTILDSSNYSTYANKTTIANNLTTTTAGSALDATQGKALNDSIDNLSEQVDDIVAGDVNLTNYAKKDDSRIVDAQERYDGYKIQNTGINLNGESRYLRIFNIKSSGNNSSSSHLIFEAIGLNNDKLYGKFRVDLRSYLLKDSNDQYTIPYSQIKITPLEFSPSDSKWINKFYFARHQNGLNVDCDVFFEFNRYDDTIFRIYDGHTRDGTVTQLYPVVNGEESYIKINPDESSDTDSAAMILYDVSYDEVKQGTFVSKADKFVKADGQSTEFLKADGSVDTNTYAKSSDLTSAKIIDTNTYSNINNTAQTQKSINEAINNRLAALNDLDLVKVVGSKPTPSANTMNKLYLTTESPSVEEDEYEIFITVRSGSSGNYTYAWEKVDTARVNLSDYIQTNDPRLTNKRKPAATLINASSTNPVDLNTIREIGFYYTLSSDDAKYVSNCPNSSTGSAPFTNNKMFYLLVESLGNGSNKPFVKQTLTYHNSNNVWVRTKNGGNADDANWSSWNQLIKDDDSRLSDARTPTSHNHDLKDLNIYADGQGGTNLIEATQNFNTPSTNVGLRDGTYQNCTYRRVDNTSGTNYLDIGLKIPAGTFKHGEKYTLSFWAKGTGNIIVFNIGGTNYIKTKPINCTSGGTNTTNFLSYNDGNVEFALTSEWKRYFVTWELNPTNNSTNDVSVDKRLILRTQVGAHAYWAGVMYERGEIPHDWSPSPKDISPNNHNHDSTYIKTGTGTVTSTNIADGTIVNADIADNAGIAYSKLSGVVSSNDTRLTDKRAPINNPISPKSDLDNFKDAGFYYCLGDTEAAPTIIHQPLTTGSQRSFSMIVELISSTRVVQKLTYYSTTDTYIRTNINNTWSTWNRVLHSGNYSDYANKTTIDSALSSTSTNPVQNKVINTALGNKADKSSYITCTVTYVDGSTPQTINLVTR